MKKKICFVMAAAMVVASLFASAALASAAPAGTAGSSPAQASDIYSEPLPLGQVDRIARQKWPTSYGGLWITSSRGKPVKVAFTKGAKAKTKTLARIYGGKKKLIPVTVKRSLKTIAKEQKKVVKDLKAVKKGKLKLAGVKASKYGIGPVVKSNTLVVQAPWVNGKTKKTFKKRYPKWVVAKRGPAKTPA